jgi:NADPH-dependent ferric siderophore reductase
MCGDETSVGLSAAAERSGAHQTFHHVIEADDDISPVFARLGLGWAETHQRDARGNHLADIESRLISHANEGAKFVLTGRAASIQRLNRTLRAAGVPPTLIRTKAYWAEGKVGLD